MSDCARRYKNPLLGHDGPPGSEEAEGSVDEPGIEAILEPDLAPDPTEPWPEPDEEQRDPYRGEGLNQADVPEWER